MHKDIEITYITKWAEEGPITSKGWGKEKLQGWGGTGVGHIGSWHKDVGKGFSVQGTEWEKAEGPKRVGIFEEYKAGQGGWTLGCVKWDETG